MKVIDQALDHLTVYDIHASQIRKSIRYETLSQVMSSLTKDVQTGTESLTFLLDEQLFSFHRFSVRFTCDSPCSIGDIRTLIQDKLRSIGHKERVATPYVIHHLSHIMINGEAEKFVLGRTGDISLCLELCVLRPAGVKVCELLGGRQVFNDAKISFYPRNYFTLQYLTQHLTKKKYSLLFIEKEMSQLVRVQDGRYHDVQYINIGLNLLKSCYQEHDVEKYFYTDRQEVEHNQFLSKVIDEAVSFFTGMLAKRIIQYVDTTTSLAVTGDIVQNPSFLPLFQDSYHVYGSGYILPLQALQHTAYDHTFSSNEITVASYLHYT